jgi:hypothetical protein
MKMLDEHLSERVQDRVQYIDLMNMVMKLRVLEQAVNVLTNWKL